MKELLSDREKQAGFIITSTKSGNKEGVLCFLVRRKVSSNLWRAHLSHHRAKMPLTEDCSCRDPFQCMLRTWQQHTTFSSTSESKHKSLLFRCPSIETVNEYTLILGMTPLQYLPSCCGYILLPLTAQVNLCQVLETMKRI